MIRGATTSIPAVFITIAVKEFVAVTLPSNIVSLTSLSVTGIADQNALLVRSTVSELGRNKFV